MATLYYTEFNLTYKMSTSSLCRCVNNKNDSIKKYPKTSEILGRASFMAN